MILESIQRSISKIHQFISAFKKAFAKLYVCTSLVEYIQKSP